MVQNGLDKKQKGDEDIRIVKKCIADIKSLSHKIVGLSNDFALIVNEYAMANKLDKRAIAEDKSGFGKHLYELSRILDRMRDETEKQLFTLEEIREF